MADRSNGSGGEVDESTASSNPSGGVRPIVGRKDFGTATGSTPSSASDASAAVSHLNLNAEAMPFEPRNPTSSSATAPPAAPNQVPSPQLLEMARRLTLLENEPANVENIALQAADPIFGSVKEFSQAQSLAEAMVNGLVLQSSVHTNSAYAYARFISILCNRLAARKWSSAQGEDEVSLRSLVLTACRKEFDTLHTQVATSPRALGFTFLLAELYMNLLKPDGTQLDVLGKSVLELLQSLGEAITRSVTTNFVCDAAHLDALLQLLKLCGNALHASHADAVDKLLGMLIALLVDAAEALTPQQRERIVRLVHLHTCRWGQLESPALPAFSKLTFATVPAPSESADAAFGGVDAFHGGEAPAIGEFEQLGDDQDIIDDSYENFLLENEVQFQPQ